MVNANYPAPEVGGNTETHIRICYTVIGALAAAVPERAFATDGGTHSNFLFGGKTLGRMNMSYATIYRHPVGEVVAMRTGTVPAMRLTATRALIPSRCSKLAFHGVLMRMSLFRTRAGPVSFAAVLRYARK